MAKRWTKLDPSRTRAERQRFMREMKRRFRKLQADLWQFLVVDDAFGLEEIKPLTFNADDKLLSGDAWQRIRERIFSYAYQVHCPIKNVKRQYQFLTTPQKLRQFQQWLQRQIDAGLLTAVGGVPGKPWTSEYVESAWRKGMMRAYTDVHKGELAVKPDWLRGSKEQFVRDAFLQPEMMSKVELLATRAFEGMKGITASMSTQMSRILADGMSNGWGPKKIARQMNQAISSLTRSRALMIARTEIIHAHAEGQLDGYSMLGVSQVSAEVEWSTAGDSLVCASCDSMSRQGPYTIKEARGLIPLHPNCRCAWVPYVESQAKRKRR